MTESCRYKKKQSIGRIHSPCGHWQ